VTLREPAKGIHTPPLDIVRLRIEAKAPTYARDLGNNLVSAGWAKPKSGGENAEYMATLTNSAEIAQYVASGIYAPPCGKPKVYGDDNDNGVADSAEVDVNVDAPDRHRHLPDGSLTGGFCRHHWWC
jgi:hypothetical protein